MPKLVLWKHPAALSIFDCSLDLVFTLRKESLCLITLRINKVAKATCGLNFRKGMNLLSGYYANKPNSFIFTQNSRLEMIIYSRVRKFLKNLEITSKLQTPQRWHEASSTLRAHNSEVTCERPCSPALCAQCMWPNTHYTHFCVSRGKTAVVMLKILGSAVKHLIALATRQPLSVYS
jgi:hypothetical protein